MICSFVGSRRYWRVLRACERNRAAPPQACERNRAAPLRACEQDSATLSVQSCHLRAGGPADPGPTYYRLTVSGSAVRGGPGGVGAPRTQEMEMPDPGRAAPAATPPVTGPPAQRPAIRWMQRLAEETSTAPGSTVR